MEQNFKFKNLKFKNLKWYEIKERQQILSLLEVYTRICAWTKSFTWTRILA